MSCSPSLDAEWPSECYEGTAVPPSSDFSGNGNLFDDQDLETQIVFFGRAPVRFVEKDSEEEFRLSRAEMLRPLCLIWLRVAAFCAVCLQVVSWLQDQDFTRFDHYGQFVTWWVRTTLLVGSAAMVVFGGYAVRFIPQRQFETVVAVSSMLLCTAAAMHSKRRAAALFGDDPLAIWGAGSADTVLPSDSSTLLLLAYLSSTLASFLPLRCKVLFVVLLYSVVMYASLTLTLPQEVLEGSDGRRLVLIFLMMMMNFQIFVGRACSEKLERHMFLQQKAAQQSLTREKVLRCKAEHEADSGPFSGAQASKRQTQASEAGSRALQSVVSSRCIFQSLPRSATPATLADQAGDALDAETAAYYKLFKLGEAEHWLLNPEHVEIFDKQVLGKGSYAVVTLGRLHGTTAVVKTPTSLESTRRLVTLANELRMFRRLRHPNIVAFAGICMDPVAMEMVLVEEFGGISLDCVLKPTHGLKDRRLILLGICKALRFLHQQQPSIIHGDLKPRNILLAPGTMHAKLADFGLSRLLDPRDELRLGGTARWMPPEAMTSGQASTAVDIFSWGRVAFFVVTNTTPLREYSPEQIASKLKRGHDLSLAWSSTTVHFYPDSHNLLKRCQQFSAEDRPSIEEVHGEVWSWGPSFLEPFEDRLCEEDSSHHNVVAYHHYDRMIEPPARNLPNSDGEFTGWKEAVAKLRQTYGKESGHKKAKAVSRCQSASPKDGHGKKSSAGKCSLHATSVAPNASPSSTCCRSQMTKKHSL
eukprot:gb/GFBE01016669.1/.p1 GENE.gb/GFBE01016669.1/~~gb/GFBE01016669.1/.p1  ORF type:complete len:755 (+),score=105.84 gb/GFBE01016669.1/:1-2265(+)